MTKTLALLLLLTTRVAFAQPYQLFLTPDSLFSNGGDTVTVSCMIGPSELLRGYTVYLAYDTNHVDLIAPPTAGTLIAGRVGLQFNFFDHIPIQPNRLEVSATVFGTDFWAGPGELFQARFRVTGCNDWGIYPPFNPFLVSATGSLPPSTLTGATVLACERVPQAPDSLTIVWVPNGVALRWKPVMLDTLGRGLLIPPLYEVWRSEVMPTDLPFAVIGSTPLPTFTDSTSSGDEHLYHVRAQGQ
ncbi:MAG: hypothetical protein IPG71_01740 [bacterium]|nr:hypothetical protein [bacterium]